MAEANIHASCVLLADAGKPFAAPADAGILLLGDSGAGKSDLALRLIAAGARLVADDRTVLTVRDGMLMAAPPPALAGLIEVRGLGIVAQSYACEARVALAVQLGEAATRLPEREFWTPPEELTSVSPVPLLRLNATEASAPAKIAMAAAALSGGRLTSA